MHGEASYIKILGQFDTVYDEKEQNSLTRQYFILKTLNGLEIDKAIKIISEIYNSGEIQEINLFNANKN